MPSDESAPVRLLRFEEPIRRWRFLLDTGDIVDVDARRDDSHLREWLLEQFDTRAQKHRIVGSTELVEPVPAPLTLLDEETG